MKRRLTLIMLAAGMALGCGDKAEEGATNTTNNTEGGTTTGGDDVSTPDADDPDAGPVEEDEGPVGPQFQPLANVYVANPVDTPETSQVELLHLAAEDHSLLGHYANVKNCLPLDDGPKINLNVGVPLEVITCTPTYSALPGDDGTYLHIDAPENHGATDDAFSEIMMYHHMQLIHDYFQTKHGLTDLDYPLEALVNIQALITLCQEWTSIGNAAFMPKQAGGFFGIDFGVEGDSIIFGQTSTKDFSYDADVIYHEYTHAMVGSTRLNAAYADPFGMNNLPGALNEAYADYFAGTLAGDSVIGNYALNGVGAQEICGIPLGAGFSNLERDMEKVHVCPDDLTAEVHADGEIFASALWAIRAAIGADKADEAIFGALVGFTQTTDFSVAAQTTIYEAKNVLSAEDAAAVEQIFNDRGLVGCDRVMPADKVGKRNIPLTFAGTNQIAVNPFGDYLPGYVQFRAELPAGVTEMQVVMYPQGQVTADLAVKPGDQPVKYAVPIGGGGHDALVVVPFTSAPSGAMVARLAGGCLSKGPWTFSIHNKGGDFQIPNLAVFSKAVPVDDVNFDPPCL